MMCPLCRTSGNHLLDDFIQLLRCQVAVKTIVDFGDWCSVADAEAAIDDLDGQFAIGGRVAVADTVAVGEFLYQLL